MVLVLAAAGVVGLLGRSQLQHAAPLVPTEAAAGLAADVDTVRDAVREGRQS